MLFQGLLKTEDVALASSLAWTQLDSSWRSFHGEERQENCGGLTPLGKTWVLVSARVSWLPLLVRSYWAVRSCLSCLHPEPPFLNPLLTAA